MMYWWKHARRGEECGAHAGGEWGYEASGQHGDHGDAGGGSFGVRRPLRFLAYKLQLNDQQVGELARILGELKTERAQADVDGRRTVAGFADAVTGAAFDDAKAQDAAALRVKSAERLRDAVVGALKKIHAVLDEEQRARLAYLIRTGTISI
jgi:Spy/CpxP family protein refolding chaperone